MLMIVRLFPKTDLSKIWSYIENNIKEDESKLITPLYATQTEGMMDIGLFFDINDPDDLTEFITEDIVKCDEVHHTKTISLMKPVFFPIPKNKPQNTQRYLVRIYAHPKYYKEIYDQLLNYESKDAKIFPIYISYTLGDEDIIMNIGADSKETVDKFVRGFVRTLNGVIQSAYYPVFRAKRFASLEKLIQEQKKYINERFLKGKKEDYSLGCDWVEDFDEYARLTGAFPGEL